MTEQDQKETVQEQEEDKEIVTQVVIHHLKEDREMEMEKEEEEIKEQDVDETGKQFTMYRLQFTFCSLMKFISI